MNLVQALLLVEEFFFQLGEPHKYSLWLETPNDMLGGISPLHMIYIGRQQKLINFIQTSVVENS